MTLVVVGIESTGTFFSKPFLFQKIMNIDGMTLILFSWFPKLIAGPHKLKNE